VLAILLSASAEFSQASGPGRNQSPKLSEIREDDQRAKASPWYQPLCYAQHGGELPVLSLLPPTQFSYFV